MAQPPDITETFVREVEENLRRDRAQEFARKYGGWMFTAVLLFLAASGGFIWWQNHRIEQFGKQGEQLSKVYTDIAAGKVQSAPKQLDALSDSGSKAVRASALFTRAALAIQQNNLKLALDTYRGIASDSSLPQPYRDMALIRQTAMEFDSIPADQVVSRLAPLAKPGNPWFGSAGELTAMALVKQGRKLDAGRLFAAMARDKDVPETIRARSVQIASTLGVDASAAMPTIAAQ